jgi:hypothetical protein
MVPVVRWGRRAAPAVEDCGSNGHSRAAAVRRRHAGAAHTTHAASRGGCAPQAPTCDTHTSINSSAQSLLRCIRSPGLLLYHSIPHLCHRATGLQQRRAMHGCVDNILKSLACPAGRPVHLAPLGAGHRMRSAADRRGRQAGLLPGPHPAAGPAGTHQQQRSHRCCCRRRLPGRLCTGHAAAAAAAPRQPCRQQGSNAARPPAAVAPWLRAFFDVLCHPPHSHP